VRVAWLALLVTRGAHVGHPLVSFRTASSVTVNSRAPLPVHVDGEVLGSGLTSLQIQVLPRRLHVLVPR
jgi:diacylglycerol kinase (ATP)